MNKQRRSAWLVPVGLILLSVVPVIGGLVRLFFIATDHGTSAYDKQFLASPLPAVVHILSVSLFSVLGALQFAPALRQRGARWHALAGRVLIPAGVLAALSGQWLSHFYPRGEFDSALLYDMRVVVTVAMLSFIAMSVLCLRRRAFAAHGAWMTRAYALGMGAGTQALTGIPWLVFAEHQSTALRTLFMGAGWAINIVVAELVIHRRRTRSKLHTPGLI